MMRGWASARDANLKPIEVEVLRLVAEGMTNKQIAQKMKYSEKQIEAMLGLSDMTRSIYAKIGVQNRARASAWYTVNYVTNTSLDPYETGIPPVLVSNEFLKRRMWEKAIRPQDVEKAYLNQDARAGLQTVQMFLNLGDYYKASEELARTHHIYGSVMDDPTKAEWNRMGGWLDYYQGNLTDSKRWFEECRRIAKQTGIELLAEGAEHFLGRIYFDWGVMYRQRRNEAKALLHKAEEHFNTAYQIHRKCCSEALQAFSLFRIAQLRRAERKWQQAEELRNQARQHLSKDPKIRHVDLEEAQLSLEDGELQIAGRKAQEALEGWASFKYPKGMANALSVLGDLERSQGNLEKASEIYIAALCIHPFDKHPDISPLWAKIRDTYSAIDIQHIQESIEERRGSFSYLNDVSADRSKDIARILARLRSGQF